MEEPDFFTNRVHSRTSWGACKRFAAHSMRCNRFDDLRASTSACNSTNKRTSNSLRICFWKTLDGMFGVAPMRILYCNKYNFPFSGTEVYLFDLMRMMREQGHEVALFSMSD